MLSVQSALSVTANGPLEAYGAAPLSVVPSEQLRLQLTSPGYEPPEQVITEEMVGGCSESGGGRVGGEGGEGGGMPTTAKSTGSHCSGQAPPRVEELNSELGRPTACE
eukprot:scaffold5892_cov56-Phaeocystis_antarctica.AAC.4